MKKLFLSILISALLPVTLFASKPVMTTTTRVKIAVRMSAHTPKKKITRSLLVEVLGFYDAEARKLTLSFLQDIGQANVSLYDKAGTVVYSQLINTGGIRVQTFLLPEKAGTYTFSIVSDNYVGTGEIVL